MQNLKKLLNPLNIPYSYQDEILRLIEGDNLLMFGEDDFIDALNLDGEVMILRLNSGDLENESSLNQSIKNELTKAKSIMIVFETSDDTLRREYKKFVQYIYSFVNDNTVVKFDLKIVDQPSLEPITIFLTGYKNDDQFVLEIGDTLMEFWNDNSDYCFQGIKKSREKISKLIEKPINSIRVVSARRSPNMIELSDAQTLQPIRVFEFNEPTEIEFDKFLNKLEFVILNNLDLIKKCEFVNGCKESK